MQVDKSIIAVTALLLIVVVPIVILSQRNPTQDDAIISEEFVMARDQGDRYYAEAQVLENQDSREKALQHYERALAYFKDAIQHRPENGEIYNNMGAIHHKIGHLIAQPKWEEDVTGYSVDDALFRLNDAMSQMEAGIIVFEVNDPEVMQAILDKAEAEGCDTNVLDGAVSSDIYMICGETADHFRKAEQMYKMAKTFKPRYGAAYQNLGTLYQETGRLEDALIWWRTALEMEPHNRRLRAYLQQYE